MLPLQLTLTTYLSFSHSFSSLFLYFPFHPNRSQSERRPLESGSAPGFFLQGGFSSQLWLLTCSGEISWFGLFLLCSKCFETPQEVIYRLMNKKISCLIDL